MPSLNDILKLLDKGNVDGALELAGDVKDKGRIVEVLNDYAALLASSGTAFDDAEKILKKAVEIDQKCAKAHYNLGCLYSEPDLLAEDEGNLKKAFESYEKAIEIEPKNTDAHYDLGLLYAFTGDVEKAEREYETLLKLDPKGMSKYDHLEGVIKSKA